MLSAWSFGASSAGIMVAHDAAVHTELLPIAGSPVRDSHDVRCTSETGVQTMGSYIPTRGIAVWAKPSSDP